MNDEPYLIPPIFFTNLPLELLLTEQDIETLPEGGPDGDY